MSDSDGARPVYGEPKPGVIYEERPAVYGIAFDAQGRVATTRDPFGDFLPGGGKEPGESDEETLKREVMEELGWELELGPRLNGSDSFHYSPRYQKHFRAMAEYFIITQWRKTGAPIEADHELVWLKPDEVEQQYFHAHQIQAVREALARRP